MAASLPVAATAASVSSVLTDGRTDVVPVQRLVMVGESLIIVGITRSRLRRPSRRPYGKPLANAVAISSMGAVPHPRLQGGSDNLVEVVQETSCSRGSTQDSATVNWMTRRTAGESPSSRVCTWAQMSPTATHARQRR